jgi:NitT/TauT family transport system substrate-binding protein
MLSRLYHRVLTPLMLLFTFISLHAAEKPLTTVRVGVLEFGTVNWELEIIQSRELAKKHGVELKIVPLASGDASNIALQGGAVDIIVSDWIWVTRQRAESNMFTFVPFSNAIGSVMVKSDSGIKKIADLQGKKLGVAGGPSDKTWLLLRAYAQRQLGVDLTQIYTAQLCRSTLAQRVGNAGPSGCDTQFLELCRPS